ncbi:MAG: FTR1 family protein [Formivibrio sp.]|nr:FTR1 family protein [Formivibrio sp.]
MQGQVLFIVWRESVEALLVVGIIAAWLRTHPEAITGRKFLWGGIAMGLLTAFGLGAAILGLSQYFEGDQQEYFQLAMVTLAAALIVQMVFWMRKHGRTLKRDMESGLAQHAAKANWWGMGMLVAVAIAREGSETVVFLYGLGLSQQGEHLFSFISSAALGFALAFATFLLLQVGSRIFSWRAFFRFTEILLLLLAGAMLVSAVEKMIGLGWLPALLDPVWNSSALLDDNSTLGNLIAALTGYRAHPALTMVLAFALYWVAITWKLKKVAAPSYPVKNVRNTGK